MKLSLKKIILFVLFVSTIEAKAQSSDESQVLQLSKQIFKWEVENKIDSLASLFDTKFLLSAVQVKHKPGVNISPGSEAAVLCIMLLKCKKALLQ